MVRVVRGSWYDLGSDSYAGTELGFIDMTQDLPESSVTVEFFTDSNQSSGSEQVERGVLCTG